MSRIAAIDTTSWWGGIALVEHRPGGDEVVAELGLQVRESHTAHLTAWLERLLDASGWPRDSIDAYAAGRGPGSFTGIRVGLGTVQGLALAAERPCFGIGSLAAMADAFGPAEADRLPLIDAGRGEVYGARYDPGGVPPRELDPPWVGPPARALDDAGGPAVVFGSGAARYAEQLVDGRRIVRAGRSPRGVAAAVGRLALARLDDAVPSEPLAPLYVRSPDAELKPKRG